jgi:tetratricopeptide (TPR) repeat protein
MDGTRVNVEAVLSCDHWCGSATALSYVPRSLLVKISLPMVVSRTRSLGDIELALSLTRPAISFALVFAILTAAYAQRTCPSPQQAITLQQQGQLKDAEEIWSCITELNSADARAWAQLGLSRSLQENYSDAVPAYRRALSLDPKLLGVQLDLGLALVKLEQFKAAIPPLKEAVADAPKDPKPKMLLGMIEYGLTHYSEAIPYLQQAVTESPENLQLRMMLAKSCLQAAKYNCALEQDKQILLRSPQSAQADILAGEALDGLGETDEAIAQFRAAETTAPHEPNVHFGLGYLLWKKSEFEGAKQEFELELADNENHVLALTFLGDIAIKENDQVSAMGFLNRAIAQPGASCLTYLDLGILHAAVGENKQATVDFQHSIRLDPNELDAYWRLARVYLAMGKKQEAHAELAKWKLLHKPMDEGLVEQMRSVSSH